MKTIRQSVFETNSSSCHSFSITTERKFDPKRYPRIRVFGSGEYGWSGPDVETPDDHLDYALVAGKYVFGDGLRDKLPAIEDYFQEHGVIVDFDFNGEPSGYIDHQSAPSEDEDSRRIGNMLDDPEELFNFVFSGSVISMGNDN
jgi:hypothetical protein